MPEEKQEGISEFHVFSESKLYGTPIAALAAIEARKPEVNDDISVEDV